MTTVALFGHAEALKIEKIIMCIVEWPCLGNITKSERMKERTNKPNQAELMINQIVFVIDVKQNEFIVNSMNDSMH